MHIVQLQIRKQLLLFLLLLILLNAHLRYELLILLLNFIMLQRLVLILCNCIDCAGLRFEASEVSLWCLFIFPAAATRVVHKARVITEDVLGDLCKHWCILILNDCRRRYRQWLRLLDGSFNHFSWFNRRGCKRFFYQPHFFHQPVWVLKDILFIGVVVWLKKSSVCFRIKLKPQIAYCLYLAWGRLIGTAAIAAERFGHFDI